MSSFRIMSFDGGGVFNTIPATLLKDKDLSKIDMFAGTSSGSFLALSYASGMDPDKVHTLFKENIPEVFRSNQLIRMIRSLYGPRYSDKKLNQLLQKVLPQKLKYIKKPIIVTSHNLAHDKFKVWDNICYKDDMDTPAWEIARMSSAAPTYFSPYHGHVDGGWTTNDPTMIAVMSAMRFFNLELSDIRVLSMGTGYRPPMEYNAEDMVNWGPINFIYPLISSVVKTGEQVAEFMTQTVRSQFEYIERFNEIALNANWKIDSVSCLDQLSSKIAASQEAFDFHFDEFIGGTSSCTHPSKKGQNNEF